MSFEGQSHYVTSWLFRRLIIGNGICSEELRYYEISSVISKPAMENFLQAEGLLWL